MAKHCIKCGKEIDEEDVHCGSCGAKLKISKSKDVKHEAKESPKPKTVKRKWIPYKWIARGVIVLILLFVLVVLADVIIFEGDILWNDLTQKTKYVCPSGSVVSSPNECPSVCGDDVCERNEMACSTGYGTICPEDCGDEGILNCPEGSTYSYYDGCCVGLGSSGVG